MSVTSFYPVLMSEDVPAAASFYRQVLGFATTFESDWYVSLRLGGFELALLAYDHETIPEGYSARPHGVILNLEVDDVDDVHHQLSRKGIEVVLPLRDEAWGQRHFIVAAPDGVLLDVIQQTPPSGEYTASYVEA